VIINTWQITFLFSDIIAGYFRGPNNNI